MRILFVKKWIEPIKCLALRKKEKDIGMIPDILFKKDWCRGTESNCRHGDFQTSMPEMGNSCISKYLNKWQ